MAWQKQPSNAPTNKVMTTVVGTSVIFTMMGPAIEEAWPQVVWAFLAGPDVTTFASVAIPALMAGVIAWFIPNVAAKEGE